MSTATLSVPRLEPGDLVSRDRAASILGVAPQTLAVWHSTGRYPLPVVKVGRRAMYRLRDIEAFVSARTVAHS